MISRRRKGEQQTWEEMDAAMAQWAFQVNRAIAIRDSIRGQK